MPALCAVPSGLAVPNVAASDLNLASLLRHSHFVAWHPIEDWHSIPGAAFGAELGKATPYQHPGFQFLFQRGRIGT